MRHRIARLATSAVLAVSVLLAGCDGHSPLVDEPVVAPEAPRLVSPGNGSDGVENAVELAWTADDTAETYELEVATDDAFSDVLLNIADLRDSGFVITGLEVGREYSWRVRARNAAGTSPWSAEFTFTPFREVVIADVPQPAWPAHNMINLPVTVSVQWTAVEGALSYDLQVAQEDVFIRRDADMTGIPGPVRELAGLVKGYEYFWRVRSRNYAGVSAWSPVWRFVVENSPDDPNGPR